ncbi:MAG: cyclic nucleotide-binding domain-containing protein [Ilumatobacteraceae bacterium]
MSKRAYLDHLRSNRLFADLTQKELQKVAAAGTEVTVPAGTVVMEQGSSGRSAIVLLDGSMVVRRNGRKIHTMSAGDVAGEMSLLDTAPRSATIVAESDCLVLEIAGAEFRRVLDEVPAVTHKLLTTMAARVRDLDTAVLG